MCLHCNYIGLAQAGSRQISGRVGRLADRRSVGRAVAVTPPPPESDVAYCHRFRVRGVKIRRGRLSLTPCVGSCDPTGAIATTSLWEEVGSEGDECHRFLEGGVVVRSEGGIVIAPLWKELGSEGRGCQCFHMVGAVIRRRRLSLLPCWRS